MGPFDPGQGVDHGVDIRIDMKTMNVLIVANIDHNGQINTLQPVEASS
jgi:hypothetical protein